MKNDIDNIFVRYGRLHLTKQQGFGKETFHSPPTKRGFYAMPIRFQEMFLIGSLEKTQPDVLNLPKNIIGEKYYEIKNKRLKKIYHKFTVKNNDVIWHHLDSNNKHILDRNGSWVKTFVYNWKKCLYKEILKLRNEGFEYKDKLDEIPKKSYYSKDHFEVFFDTKVV